MNVVNLNLQREDGGLYTVSEAATYIKAQSPNLVRNWAFGTSKSDPVLARQYPRSRADLGFYDLMELRFIDYFRRQGVSLQSLRKAASRARKELQLAHPFASNRERYVTDRKRVFAQAAEETKDTKLRELVTGQYAFYEVIEETIANGVVFDPSTAMARAWRPNPSRYPAVQLTPNHAYGHPSLARLNVPTRALAEVFRAEGNSYVAAADWFEVSEDLVREAVAFEVEYAFSEVA